MTPDFLEHQYDEERLKADALIADLKRRRAILEGQELNERTFAQLTFLDGVLTAFTGMHNNTMELRRVYLSELDRFVEAQIELKKVKLNNSLLIKGLPKFKRYKD